MYSLTMLTAAVLSAIGFFFANLTAEQALPIYLFCLFWGARAAEQGHLVFAM
jgi:hypothetical protein